MMEKFGLTETTSLKVRVEGKARDYLFRLRDEVADLKRRFEEAEGDERRQVEIGRQYVKKKRELVEFLEKKPEERQKQFAEPWPSPYYYPRELKEIRRKTKYRETEKIEEHKNSVWCLQALPDNRIVSGSYDNTIKMWTKGADGKWKSEKIGRHEGSVYCLQALPDGRIVSGSNDKTIKIWEKGEDGKWESEEIGRHESWVYCLQALPDGRIVSGSYDNTIKMWTKGADGKWKSEKIGRHEGSVYCLQALPDGRIVSGSYDNTLRIWDGEDPSPR